MAPQNESSFYGSLRLGEEKEAPRSRGMLRRVALMGLVTVAVLGAAFYASSSTSASQDAAQVDVQIQRAVLEDCICESTCKSFNQWKDADGNLGWIDQTDRAYAKLNAVEDDVRLCEPDLTQGPCFDNSGREARSFKKDGNGPVMAFCLNMRGCIEADQQDDTTNVCGEKGFCVPSKNPIGASDPTAHTCVCDEGFEYKAGPTEEDSKKKCRDIDECDASNVETHCHEWSQCSNSIGSYTCECNKGFSGLALPKGRSYANRQGVVEGCKENAPCSAAQAPCNNGAKCIDVSPIMNGKYVESLADTFVCECVNAAAGYTGTLCEQNINECDPDERGRTGCGLNALCQDTEGSFTCACDTDHGWESKGAHVCQTTEESLSFKAFNRDANGNIGKSTTPCQPPSAVSCTARDYCAPSPCKNGGTCLHSHLDTKEELSNGCNHDEEEALKWAIAKKSTIQDFFTANPTPVICFTCDCTNAPGGWKGTLCDTDVNECVESDAADRVSCDANAYCANTLGSHTCACNRGWTGNGFKCVDADDCETNPCSHGGTCQDCGTLCFTCDCVLGWQGVTCGTDWNECLMGMHICNDAATCVNTPGSYVCRCDAGWTGDGQGPNDLLPQDKESKRGPAGKADKFDSGCININDCEPNPCKNSGSCTDMSGSSGYICRCADGWRDENCDMNMDECNPTDPLNGFNQCSDKADCIDRDPSKPAGQYYACECKYGYRDPLYTTKDGARKTDADLKLIMARTGSKTLRPEGFLCTDADDCVWKKTDSEVEAGTRSVGPKCNAHGFCSDLGIGYSECECDKGWHGADCELDVDECTSESDRHQCEDHTVCVNTPGSYECTCETGFDPDGSVGDVTEHAKGCRDHDDCTSSKCVNEKKCTGTGLGAGRYDCECKDGWKDFDCDHDVDECRDGVVVVGQKERVPAPCATNAKCVNTEGSYFCRCKAGFAGNGIQKNFIFEKTVDGEAAVTKIMGDGCLDIDDCADAVNDEGKKTGLHCDIDHGTCRDAGANRRVCDCAAGWGGHANKGLPNRCSVDINECRAQEECKDSAGNPDTSGACNSVCATNALCTNTPGSYTCSCNGGYFDGNTGGTEQDLKDGRKCTKCLEKCPNQRKSSSGVIMGREKDKACSARSQLLCKEVNECDTKGAHNCHADAMCSDLASSNTCDKDQKTKAWIDSLTGQDCMFSCACKPGFFGTGHGLPTKDQKAKRGESPENWDGCATKQLPYGCMKCTACQPGYTESEPCTPTADRICERDLLSGTYLMESQADGNLQCVAISDGRIYPSRVNYGNGGKCGYMTAGQSQPMDYISKTYTEAVWQFEALYSNSEGEDNMSKDTLGGEAGTDLYTISHADMSPKGNGRMKCLFFGGQGKALYPSLASCDGYDEGTTCPWAVSNDPTDKLCGFQEDDGEVRKDAFIENKLAVWKIQAVKSSEGKYILQNRAQGGIKWECLAFEEQGAATNPSRYMWGNQDSLGWCGIGDWDNQGKQIALMKNMQAVYILTAFSEKPLEAGAKTC